MTRRIHARISLLPFTEYERERQAFLDRAGDRVAVADWRKETRQSYLNLEFSL
jgi:hypothetical protein